MSQQPPPDPSEIILSAADINRAGAEGVISQSDADRLIRAYDQRSRHTVADLPLLPTGKSQRFNPSLCSITGALLMISPAWFR